MPSIPKNSVKSPITRTYKKFAGVDFTSDPSNVQINRSPCSVNMYKDYKSSLGQAIETRPGFINLYKLNNAIYGIHFFNTSSLKVIVHSGIKLYWWKGFPNESDVIEIYSGMSEVKSRSFIYNDKLYINDGINYIFYDDTTVKKVTEVAFIPTTTMSRNPTGRRYNIPTSQFITT